MVFSLFFSDSLSFVGGIIVYGFLGAVWGALGYFGVRYGYLDLMISDKDPIFESRSKKKV